MQADRQSCLKLCETSYDMLTYFSIIAMTNVAVSNGYLLWRVISKKRFLRHQKNYGLPYSLDSTKLPCNDMYNNSICTQVNILTVYCITGAPMSYMFGTIERQMMQLRNILKEIWSSVTIKVEVNKSNSDDK